MAQSQAVIDRAIALAAAASSRSAIAGELGLSKSTVAGLLWRRASERLKTSSTSRGVRGTASGVRRAGRDVG
jgi:orotate phosphoribosyltransferase-like protein